MAESRLADIYRKELKTKGLLGALVSASGARLKEKTDIRGILPQTGVSGAAFEKMFGKRYKYGGDKQAVRSSGGSDSASTKSMEEKLTRIGVDGKITAKNSMSLPIMASQMNLMQKNIAKIVKLNGGTPSSKADSFFTNSKFRENAYEASYNKNSRNTSPTAEGGKNKESSLFDTILSGLSSIFSLKGGLIAALLAAITFGIREYFTNDEFKERVNVLAGELFTVMKDFLKEYWKEAMIAFALLFPGTTLSLISSGLSLLSTAVSGVVKILGSELVKDSLFFAFRSLITVLTGPAGLIVLLGAALFAAKKLYDQNQEEYLKLAKEKKEKGSLSEKDEARLKQLNSPANEAAAEKQLGYNPMTNKVVTEKEANRSMDQRSLDSRASDGQLKRQAEDELMDEAIKSGKNPNNISNEDINTRFELLKKQRNAINAGPNESAAESKRLGLKPTTSTSPSPAAPAASSSVPAASPAAPAVSTSPTKTSTDTSSTVKTFASLTREQQDAVMIEQRKREGFYPGKDGKPGSLSYDLNNPGNMLYGDFAARYGGMPDTTGRGVGDVKGKFARFPTLQDGIEAQRALWLSPKYANLPLDQAINRWTTGKIEGTGDPGVENYKASVIAAAGGTYTPGTSLASAPASEPSQQAGSPSTGNSLSNLFAEYSTFRDNYMKQNGGTSTTVNAPVTNVSQSSGGGSNNTTPYNNDMMRYLLRPVT